MIVVVVVVVAGPSSRRNGILGAVAGQRGFSKLRMRTRPLLGGGGGGGGSGNRGGDSQECKSASSAMQVQRKPVCGWVGFFERYTKGPRKKNLETGQRIAVYLYFG